MLWASWAHRCRSVPAAVSQWSEFVVKRTGPQEDWSSSFGLTWKMRSSLSSLRKKSALAHYYANTKVAAKLVYLCDISSQLNQLISLQGRNSNKEKGQVSTFVWHFGTPAPQVIISDSEHSQHLSQLIEKFKQYFSQHPREGHQWILDPFTANDVALPSIWNASFWKFPLTAL